MTRVEWKIDASNGKAKAKIYLTDVPVFVEAKEIEIDPPAAIIFEAAKKFNRKNAGS